MNQGDFERVKYIGGEFQPAIANDFASYVSFGAQEKNGSIPQTKVIMGRAAKMNEVYFVIPAKAGIQEFQQRSDKLDSRLHGNDDF